VKLPAAHQAIIESAKVRDYLLSSEHPIGRAKARFFRALGFTHGQWSQLHDALLALARTGDAVPGKRNAFGQKYVVRGILTGPSGRSANIVTVWIVLESEAAPRFVTAYPGASS